MCDLPDATLKAASICNLVNLCIFDLDCCVILAHLRIRLRTFTHGNTQLANNVTLGATKCVLLIALEHFLLLMSQRCSCANYIGRSTLSQSWLCSVCVCVSVRMAHKQTTNLQHRYYVTAPRYARNTQMKGCCSTTAVTVARLFGAQSKAHPPPSLLNLFSPTLQCVLVQDWWTSQDGDDDDDVNDARDATRHTTAVAHARVSIHSCRLVGVCSQCVCVEPHSCRARAETTCASAHEREVIIIARCR